MSDVGFTDGDPSLLGTYPPDAPYLFMFNSRGPAFSTPDEELLRGPIDPITGVPQGNDLLNEDGVPTTFGTLGPTVVTPGYTTATASLFGPDSLTHEFGHGVHDVEAGLTTFASSQFFTISEHVADTFAVLEDGYYTRSVEEQLCLQVDEGLFGATSPFPCAVDADCPAGAGACTPAGRCALSCLRYFGFGETLLPGQSVGECEGRRHFTEFFEPRIGEPFDPDSHQNSCILTKLYALATEIRESPSAPRTYHHVDVGGIDFEILKRLFHDLVRTDLHTAQDLIDYGYAYRLAVDRASVGCRILGTCGPERAAGLMAPAWAIGLWSPRHTLGNDLGRIASAVGPAAAVRPDGISIFYVPPTGPANVWVFEAPSLADDTHGTARDLTIADVALPPTRSDLAVASTGRLITLAVVPTGGTAVVLARTRSESDSTWEATIRRIEIPLLRDGPGELESAGKVALAHLPLPGAPWLLVVERRDDAFGLTDLAFVTETGATSPSPREVPDSLGETAPALFVVREDVFPPRSHVELWTVDRTHNLHRRIGSVAGDGSVEWSAPERVRVRETVAPVAVCRSDADCATGSVCEVDAQRIFLGVPIDVRRCHGGGAVGDAGLVAHPFQGRTQLFVRRGAPDGRLSHEAYQTVDGSGVHSQTVTLRGEWDRRPTAFQIAGRDGIPEEVLLTVDSSASGGHQLVYYLSRSD
jgi:hypothetical protein